MTITSGTSLNTDDETLTYTPTSLVVPSGTWLTIDMPFISGTTATSVYQSGTRYAVTVGGTYDYETNLKQFQLNYTGYTAGTNTVQIKEIEYYKSIAWSVHSLKDMTDGYMIFNCVRTKGRYDSRRRAYE